MLKIKANKPAFYALRIMKKVSINNVFRAKEFNREMKRLGYITPQKFTWDYNKKGLVNRIKKGYYQLL